MSGLLAFLVAVLVLATAIRQRDLALAVLAATSLGMYVGRWATMAYRRGTILRLEREVDGYRVQDEDDD